MAPITLLATLATIGREAETAWLATLVMTLTVCSNPVAGGGSVTDILILPLLVFEMATA